MEVYPNVPEQATRQNEPPAAGFVQVPNEVALSPQLSHGAFRTYVVLQAYAYGEKVSCYPGQERLATEMGVKVRMVRKYIGELEDAGLIEVVRPGWRRDSNTGKQTNVYRFKPLTSASKRHHSTAPHRYHSTAKENKAEENKVSPPGGADTPLIDKKSREHKTGIPDPSATTTAPSVRNPTPKSSAKELVAQLVKGLEAQGFYLDREQKDKYGANFDTLIGKGVGPVEMRQVRERIVQEWSRIQLSPQGALSDIRGVGTWGRKKATPSPPEAIEAIRTDSDLNMYAGLATQWDFTQEAEPPVKVVMALGGNPQERARNQRWMRVVSRRAVQNDQEDRQDDASGPAHPAEGVAGQPNDAAAEATLESVSKEERQRRRKVVEDAKAEIAAKRKAAEREDVRRLLCDPDSNPGRLARGYAEGRQQLDAVVDSVSWHLTGTYMDAEQYRAAVEYVLDERLPGGST